MHSTRVWSEVIAISIPLAIGTGALVVGTGSV